MSEGVIFDIKEFAVFDGPGVRTTVFMKGCPLRCQWCHNPEGLSPKPQLMVSISACTHCGRCKKICRHPDQCIVCGECIPQCPGGLRRIAGVRWEASKLAERIQKDRDIYVMSGGGVTFSGGEPLMQWEFVSEVISKLGGIPVAIETSGYTTDGIFSEVMELCDLVMIDWKASDPQKHRHYTGVEQEPIRRHVSMLAEGSTPFILRMPIIPGVNDNREHFVMAAELVKGAKALVRIDILPYQRAAGAKYEMVGKKYKHDFDDAADLHFYTDEFVKRGIPYKQFR